jgi:hypothetical protein
MYRSFFGEVIPKCFILFYATLNCVFFISFLNSFSLVNRNEAGFLDLRGVELRAHHLNHFTSPFLCALLVFAIGLSFSPGLVLNCDPPDLCLPNS